MERLTAHPPAHEPTFPAEREQIGIAVVGFGNAARRWHLPAYRKYGLNVSGVFDVDPQAMAQLNRDFPGVRGFRSVDELLAAPDVQVVDIATRPPGRVELIHEVLQADKHLLVQKPVSADLTAVRALVEEALARRCKVAVNQNGRWAPAWRVATILIGQGTIGQVQAVTHLYDTRLSWIPNPAVQGTDQFLLYDYSIHWIDIVRCWLSDRRLAGVQARDYPAPHQLLDGSYMQNMWMSMDFEDGTNALIRGVGSGHTQVGHPFWIHGTSGSIRGSVDSLDGDYVEMERGDVTIGYELTGSWFPDGFAGTMGELLCAIVEDREPSISLDNNLLTLEASLAGCASARRGGERVGLLPEPSHP